MSKIRILPENLANQIAAGEVVERPASVVKEFIENAIDAAATKISIQVGGDGTRLIRVVDNGDGMEQDDLLLCLERHATSKLRAVQDLDTIATLGFRGEAIPSIASVAKLMIVSKTQRSALGNKAEIRFGKIIKVHEMGCAAGTTMEVKDLFANLPARRKFLKSKKTEISHIDDVVKNYALVNPNIGFTYEVEGRVVLDLPVACNSQEERVQTIACRNVVEPLLKLAGVGGEKQEIEVSGYLATPGISGGNGGLHLFVNGRVVRDRGITHAVSEGLQGFLLKGRRPTGVVFLSLPPSLVDVNVHPTKQEVRFQRAGQVYEVFSRAVRSAMVSYQDTRRQDVFGMPEIKESKETSSSETVTKNESPRIDLVGRPGHKLDIAGGARIVFPTPEPSLPQCDEKYEADIPATLVTSEDDASQGMTDFEAKDVLVEPAIAVAENLPHPVVVEAHENSVVEETPEVELPQALPRYVGQVFDTYILCEMEGSFVVVDQHAAQERLIFENIRQQYAKKAVPKQALLFPDVVELTIIERQVVEQNNDEIQRLGLEIKEFGGESFIITAVPAPLGHLAPGEVLRGILSQFVSEDEGVGRATRLENVLAVMACKASVKAGNRLLPQEAEALLSQMWKAGVFSHCPHGRPVARVFSKDEVKKWFLRT